MNDKITAIICEYNPFHNGHKYQIEKAREKSNIIICIMSGNMVQRGGFACTDKYSRARIAVENGADLVVEHPFPFCSSSAADFAASGVFVAASLGANALAFGHESEKEILCEISEILSSTDSNSEIYKIIKDTNDTKKLSYPRAREIYIEKLLGKEKAAVLRYPNNILSVEYLINLKKYQTVEPMFIKRNFDHISAGAIREKIYSGENVFSHVPSVPEKLLDFSFLDKTVLSMLAFHGGYNEHYDCDFSLYKRITQYSKKVKSIDELINICTSSSYTSSKIRRCIYSIIFDVRKSDVKSMPSFTNLLASSEKGIIYLSKNRKKITFPVLSKVSDGKKQKIDISLSSKPDLFYSIISGEKFEPYKQPYIEKRD